MSTNHNTYVNISSIQDLVCLFDLFVTLLTWRNLPYHLWWRDDTVQRLAIILVPYLRTPLNYSRRHYQS